MDKNSVIAGNSLAIPLVLQNISTGNEDRSTSGDQPARLLRLTIKKHHWIVTFNFSWLKTYFTTTFHKIEEGLCAPEKFLSVPQRKENIL